MWNPVITKFDTTVKTESVLPSGVQTIDYFICLISNFDISKVYSVSPKSKL